LGGTVGPPMVDADGGLWHLILLVGWGGMVTGGDRGRKKDAYVSWNPLPADDVAFGWGDARDGARGWWVHTQSLLEHGIEVGELGDGDAVDFFFVRERGSDFVDELLVRFGFVEKVKGDAAEQSRGRLGPSGRQDGGRALQFHLGHTLFIVVSEDVGDEVRSVDVFPEFQSFDDGVLVELHPFSTLLPECPG